MEIIIILVLFEEVESVTTVPISIELSIVAADPVSTAGKAGELPVPETVIESVPSMARTTLFT